MPFANRDLVPVLLSPNELKVLALILKGVPLTLIASELMINAKTVSTYKSRIMVKLNVESNAELVTYGMINFGIAGVHFKIDE
jgi:DNA-binding CsgD family transcriptional regulator